MKNRLSFDVLHADIFRATGCVELQVLVLMTPMTCSEMCTVMYLITVGVTLPIPNQNVPTVREMLKCGCTLYRPLEEGLAGLAGGHAVVVARSDVSTHQAQAFGDGVEHVFALDGARILQQSTGAVLIALAAGAARGPQGPGRREHGRRVQAVGVAVDGTGVAATGVRVGSGTRVAGRVHQRGWTGRFRLYVRATAGRQVPLLSGHPVQQPGREKRKEREGKRVSATGIHSICTTANNANVANN